MYFARKYRTPLATALSLVIPIAIASLRYDVGTDYYNYVNLFNQQVQIPFSRFLENYQFGQEIGFYLLIKMSNIITGDVKFLFAFMSTMTVLFLYLGLRKMPIKHYALVYLMFLFTLFPNSLNIVRQAAAVSIFFYAFHFIVERKLIRYSLLILLASTLHVSALALLPLYLINRIIRPVGDRFSRAHIRVGIIALAISLAVPLALKVAGNLAVFSRYDLYQSFTGSGGNYTFGLKIVIAFLCILFIRHLKVKSEIKMYLLFFTILEILLLSLGFTSSFTKRIALYFSPFSLLLLSSIPEAFEERSAKLASYGMILMYGVMFFYISFFVLGQADITPYRFIIGKHE